MAKVSVECQECKYVTVCENCMNQSPQIQELKDNFNNLIVEIKCKNFRLGNGACYMQGYSTPKFFVAPNDFIKESCNTCGTKGICKYRRGAFDEIYDFTHNTVTKFCNSTLDVKIACYSYEKIPIDNKGE